MRPLVRDEIVGLELYAELRDAYRDAVIVHKKNRRLAVGESVTLVFEDRETLRFQVQEMLWVERICEPEQVQREIDVYNELMPRERELSATLLVEITEPDRVKAELDRLVGIDEHVSLTLGEESQAETIRARFDPKQLEEDRISAVQYIRFPFTAAQRERFCDASIPASVHIDHAHYCRECEISPALRASLIGDLSSEPTPLLPAADSEPGGDVVLFATDTVRALRPAHPRAPGHVVIEPLAPVASLLEADEALMRELLTAVRRVAAELVQELGACRIQTDVGRGGARLRWHVYAPPPD